MSHLVAYFGNEPENLACALSSARGALYSKSAPGGARVNDGFGLGFVQGGDVLLRKRPRAETTEVDLYGLARDTRAEHLAEVESLAAQSAALAAAIRDAQAGSTGSGTPSAAGFIWPVDGPVVSGFGVRWGRMHEGIDIAATIGTPIRAAASGTVIHAGWLGGYGNLVVVDHGDGLATAYAHASAILVAVGQQVSQGDTLSLVGSTGNSTGPHLHFEVRVNGSAVDPLLYL